MLNCLNTDFLFQAHSAKFENEKLSENIQNAISRYSITWPCFNDSEMVLLQSLGLESWPSYAIIGPNKELLLLLDGTIFSSRLMEFFRLNQFCVVVPNMLAIKPPTSMHAHHSPATGLVMFKF